uniref:beta-galactoside alpha-(2,6)-sialyltransferase n=1 Tax=Clastoptera arizonana TaxID=38151 RepID=A0A1B6CPZ8_9HEMI
MKAIAVSVWIFINLVFFGMCGYIYLLWSQYWLYISRQKQHQDELVRRSDTPLVDYFQEPIVFNEQLNQPISGNELRYKKTTLFKRKNKPRFARVQLTEPPTYRKNCSKCKNNLNRLSTFKDQLVVRFRQVLHEESNVFISKKDNPYGVKFSGRKIQADGKKPKTLICDLKQVLPKVNTISGFQTPFIGTDLGRLIPRNKLFSQNEHYNNCAIITNSGAFTGSRLGPLIDNHDLVLRFNHAPTKGYELDVGSKTSIRILNSQVVSKPEFNFLSSSMYRNIKLLAWDPCNYTTSLEKF